MTGANKYFTMSELTRLEYGLAAEQLARISPPGTRHLRGLSFRPKDWEALRDTGESVWILQPPVDDETSTLRRYLEHGESLGVPEAYKCQVRSPWWRPSLVSPPDLFFTYMSHRYPRLIANPAKVSFVNSMHGVRLKADAPKCAKSALPLLALNSVTMLGAEIYGRSYGGGVLKMEPREAASLPVPAPRVLEAAWKRLSNERSRLDRQLRNGLRTTVAKRVEEVLLRDILKLAAGDAQGLHEAARSLRERRLGSEVRSNDGR